MNVEASTVGRLVLRNGRDAAGVPTDVAVDGTTGLITDVGVVEARAADVVEDVRGMVILPAGAEPHAHLDKALAAGDLAAMPVDLAQAVDDWRRIWPTLTEEDFVARAMESVVEMVHHGDTLIRTHIDIGAGVGLRGVSAMLAVRDEAHRRGLCDIQVVGLAAQPMSGTVGAEHRRLLEEAIDAGIDVVGGSPDLDPDPVGGTAAAVEMAAAHGMPIDMHTDQTVDRDFFVLPEYVRLVREHGLAGASASHCISLSTQSLDVQRRTAAELAEAGIAVFVMPLTSLFFFGWDEPVGPPRGVAPVRVLEEAGVLVAAGADNVRDVFFPYGRFDPLETAAVLAMVAHLDPDHAWQMCSNRARIALGHTPVELRPGSPAELLVVAGRSITEAVGAADPSRLTIHRGRIVARTDVRRHLTV
ncbi:MAG: amidohydrolase family protein [Ilumatobacteraceae bacterium]